jgi:phage tail-like protein
MIDLDHQQYVLLDRRAGWRAALLDGVEASPAGEGLRLQALPSAGRPLVDAAGSFGGLVEPTGVAVDPWGRVYLTDRAGNAVKRFDPCCAAFETLPCIGGEGGAPRQLRGPRGIAVSKDGVLYLVDEGNRRVQVFSVKGFALLGILGPIDKDGRYVRPSIEPPAAAPPSASQPCPPAVTFPTGTWQPWDVVIDGRGRALVSDRANGLIQVFDRHGRRRHGWNGAGPGNPALVHPTHLAIDREDRTYIVQEDRDYVVVLDREGKYLGRAEPPERLRGRFRPGPVGTDARGNLYIVDLVSRRLYCYRCPGPPGTPVSFTGASTGLDGPVAGLAFDAEGRPLATDPSGATVVHLDGELAFTPEGRYHSTALDSGQAGCQWHQIVLRGRLPASAAVRVDTYTTDAEKDEEEILALPEEAWATGRSWIETALVEWDCLVLSGPGRFLWLRLTLTGTGTATPLVSAVKAVFPRRSSAEFLPAVYRTTPGSTFLERFLSIFDTLFGRVEGILDRLPSYFDPCATPATTTPDSRLPIPSPDFLSWLASWLGLDFEGTWDEAKRRDVLRCAIHLYAWRGTPRGIREAVQVIAGMDQCGPFARLLPGVLEDFQLRRWWFLGGSTLGDQTMLWGKRVTDRLQLSEHSTIGEFKITDVGDPLRDPFHHYAHRFTVFVPAARVPAEGARRAVERIVEASKPAHTQHRVEFVEPRFRVGVQATLGIDTAIGGYPAGVTAGAARVCYDAVLQDSPSEPATPRFRVGIRSQLGGIVL